MPPLVVFQGEESSAGAPEGRQCVKPGWSPCCCCDGACWLALPCVASYFSSVALFSSTRAVCLQLTLTEVFETNAFSQVHLLVLFE